MRLGVHLVSFDFPDGDTAIGPTLAEVGRVAELTGVDNISCMDHWFQLGFLGPAEQNMLEGYTTLGYLAAVTERVELQLLVTGVTYRHPGLVAKIVSTLDVLSGGRAVLGLGAAWYEREHLGLGVAYPPLGERFERLEETLQIVRQMWSPDTGPFEGKHYQLAETLCSPQPLRSVPIMIGGSGERKTLRLVAAYADACNLFTNAGIGVAAVERKLGVLREHCEREGRSYDSIRKTILWTGADPSSDPAVFAEDLKPYGDLGIEEVHVMHLANEPVQFLRDLEPVIPAVHNL
jgi:F420-dependent oxidoreductase-like protein